jgi:hypothetical protein
MGVSIQSDNEGVLLVRMLAGTSDVYGLPGKKDWLCEAR